MQRDIVMALKSNLFELMAVRGTGQKDRVKHLEHRAKRLAKDFNEWQEKLPKLNSTEDNAIFDQMQKDMMNP